MKTAKKALLLAFCAVLLVVASVLGTMAYLTSSDTVTNTFTVGKVGLILDEKDYDGSKTDVTTEGRDKKNTYHLLPGHEYDKDPTVTVLKDSEKSFVRMIVTIDKQTELDEIFKAEGGVSLDKIFSGYNAKEWTLVKETEISNDVRSYEFHYKEVVDKVTEEDGRKLSPLFTKITVPGEITKEQLATIADLKIEVEAHAIQADGFADADKAWAAFKK